MRTTDKSQSPNIYVLKHGIPQYNQNRLHSSYHSNAIYEIYIKGTDNDEERIRRVLFVHISRYSVVDFGCAVSAHRYWHLTRFDPCVYDLEMHLHFQQMNIGIQITLYICTECASWSSH